MGNLSPDHLHDIFISYSHGDYVHDGMSELAVWSQQFAEKLERELRQDPKFAEAAVFIDASKRVEHGLDPMLPLAEEIRSAIEASALFMILMSPQYIKSDWCTKERALWLEQLKQHDSSGNFWDRTLFARIWPLEDAAWPQELRDSEGHPPLGIWYHSRKEMGVAVRPFGWSGRTDEVNEYTDALLTFVAKITQRMTSLQKQLAERKRAREEAQRLEAEDGQVLYLYSREEHREVWSNAYSSLDKAQYIVTPAQPEPTADTPEKLQAISHVRVGQLLNCDALLLLGTKDGFALDGDMLSVGRQTRNLGRALSRKLLPCAVLDWSGGSVATTQRLAAARRLNIDWIDVSLPDWLQRLRNWLQDMRKKLDPVT